MNKKEALEILNFSSSDNPSRKEINKAYKSLALKYHPDKHSDKSEDVKKQYEEKVKKIILARDVLVEKDQKIERNTKKSTKPTSEGLDIKSTEELKIRLGEAISKKDITFLKKLFSKFKSNESGEFGDYINKMHFSRMPPLFLAIFSDDIDLVRLLLENNADPNVQNKEGDRFPLFEACRRGHYRIVELLLEHGADPNIQNRYGNTLLNMNFRPCDETLLNRADKLNQYYKILELLLNHGIKLDAQSVHVKVNHGFTLLERSLIHGEFDKVLGLLIKRGLDPNVQDEQGRTPLYEAVFRMRRRTIKVLLEHKADPNIQNKYGGTPLYQLCIGMYSEHESYKIIELLLEHGANPNIQNERGHTPLYGACSCKQYRIIDLLLEHGADPNVKDKSGRSLLHILNLDKEDSGVFGSLLKYHVDFSVKDTDGKTLLYKASINHGCYVIRKILERSNGIKSECVSDLLFAAVDHNKKRYIRGKYEDTVEVLLKYGADPNRKIGDSRLIECTTFFKSDRIYYKDDLINCINDLILPYGSNDKAKKLMAEYGGVDRRYLASQVGFAFCCLVMASVLSNIASFWCYVPIAIFTLAACFFVKNALHAAFFAKIKEPSPKFVEIEEVYPLNDYSVGLVGK